MSGKSSESGSTKKCSKSNYMKLKNAFYSKNKEIISDIEIDDFKNATFSFNAV